MSGMTASHRNVLRTCSLVDHICEHGKDEHIQARDRKKNCFICQVAKHKGIIGSTRNKTNSEEQKDRGQQSHWRKIHASPTDKLHKSKRIFDGLNMAFANAPRIANWHELNTIAISHKTNRDGGRKTKTVG
jgi:hypothetical protein